MSLNASARCCALFLITLIKSLRSEDFSYDEQPRLSTTNGHLHIISAMDRNITLQTSGDGHVNLNGENLLHITKKAKSVNTFFESFRMYELPEIKDKLSRYSEYLEGTHGLVQKMARFDGSVFLNGSGGLTNATSRNIPNLERTVRRLARDVLRLKQLLQADECFSNPCRNGGTCIDHFNGFQCQCPDAWEGVLCDEDVNECSLYANTHMACQNGGSCVNKPGYYECSCVPGFYGVRCTESTNNCDLRSDELCVHGICVNQKNSYKCICDQGWTTDGKSPACVVDVNECETHFSCSKSPAVECINTAGSYRCGTCPVGYSGNGHYCVDINECLYNNGGCSLIPRVVCLNLPGSAICGACPPGYAGDGRTCKYQGGPCFVDNGGCHPKASCIQNIAISENYVQCICPPNYEGSGYGPAGCTPTSVVSTTNLTDCPSSRCNNHGVCVLQATDLDFKCLCDVGYTGTYCEITEDPCSPNPCENGGTCSRVPSDPLQVKCACPSGFIGHFCHLEREVCRGVYTTPSGVLSFPESPNATYPHDSNCAWIIRTNSSLVLNVSFDYFALESSLDCKVDWLQINDGPDTTHNLIGSYCGSTKPKNFTSSSNAVHVWFRSDSTKSMAGFRLQWTSVQPSCGGTISDKIHGSISSPGSPRRYPKNRDCYWHIEVPMGYRILFTFFNLQIGSGTSENCTTDHLEIINGFDDYGPVLEKLCGSNVPHPVYSSSSTAVLHFHSDNITGPDEVGFQLTFAAVRTCGGLLDSFSGIIASPKHPERPDEYIADSVCEWTIQMPPNERVVLHFLSFDLEDSDNCTYDHLEIFDGPNFASPLLGKFCGSKKTILPIISTKNQVSIRLTTDLTNSGVGFQIKYELLCGGEFSAESGHFNSPLFPNYYPDEKRCTYLLSQPLGKAIEVKFIEFELEASEDNCDLDYLKAYDGENENATLIGTYCLSNRPSTIVSKHNYLFFVFETDSTISKRGFYANYSAIDIVCGGILKANSSTITSPKHPNKYPLGQTCQWVISAPPGFFIQLTWTEFSLEMQSQCLHDYVEIYDNSSVVSQALSIGRYCGSKLPPPVTTTGNLMTIIFVSDTSISMDGFSANYVMLNGSRMCGGNYYSTTGYIRTPNYPYRYPYNRNCVWTITVPPGQQIKLQVQNFTLEPNKFCRYDYLEIRQGGYATSPLIGKYCGYSGPPNITSHGNQLYFKFVSDGTTSMDGFSIFWDGTSTGCGGILTSPTGSITSPNYPNTYGGNTNCIWKIAVNKGSVIKVTIVDIDLDSMFPGTCWSNYLNFYDGPSAKNPLLGQFCRSGQNSVLKSTKNEMFIKFRSSRRFEGGKGFFLQYTSDCNVTLKGHLGVIESPNFPETYPAQANCLWHIEAPKGNRINVSFSHFDLNLAKAYPYEGVGGLPSFTRLQYELTVVNRNCSDFVEVKEGPNASGESLKSLGKLCGKTSPKMITSSQENVYVHFKSNDFFAGTGFRLEWMVYGCGGMFMNRQRGKFSTPNYPNHYPPRIQCDWYIIADWDKQIVLNIPRIDIEDDDTRCEMDSLTIYSGEDDTAPVLTRICQSQTTPVIVHSHGNKAFVRFLSDMSYSGAGFEASYYTSKADCGGIFKAPSGSIFSPNYPKNYKDGEECQWLISVKQNHLVNLTFSDFDVGVARQNPNCSSSYVDVFDGATASEGKATRFCGNKLPKSFISTSNKLLVRLRARMPTTKGFAANYTTACGAVIETDNSGVISSDIAVFAHQETYECDWIIRALKPESKITFFITHMNIPSGFEEAQPSCSDNALMVYDGDDTNATKLLSVCGTALPSPITSSGPSILISLKLPVYPSLITKRMHRFSGFYSIRSTDCGGTLTSEQGTISSPNYPNGYPRMTDCTWTLSASPGNKMQLVFSAFNLVDSDKCNEDYVEIREKDVAGKLLSISCGDSMPALITASHAIWVKFHSGAQADTTGKGFTADFTLLNQNELDGPSGTITSPLFPLTYMFDKVFTWRILVSPKQAVMLSFNSFSIEKTSTEENVYSEDGMLLLEDNSCISELKIYDGFDDTAPLLAVLCGYLPPASIVSSSSYLFIEFHSSVLFTGSSFSLSWTEVPQKTAASNEKKSNSTCDKNIYLSANSPSNISYTFNDSLSMNALHCNWIVRCDKGYHITLRFDKVNLYKQTYLYSCNGGLSVYEGTSSSNWKLIKSLCAPNTTGTFIEGSNLMKISLSLVGFVELNSKGLSITASLVCGGVIDEPNGILEVGELSKLIHERREYFVSSYQCVWSIIVKPGRTIKFGYPQIFDQSSAAKSKNIKDCDRAYVMIKNGQDDDYPMLGNGKYCNDTFVSIPETTSNKAYVKFVSTASEFVGLKMSFQEVSIDCNNKYDLTDNFKTINITSPEYPNAPPPHTECVWRISAPLHEIIRVTFPDQFDFSYSSSCDVDYIELRDGLTEVSRLLGRFCDGAHVPNSLFTTGNQLLVKYFTDVRNPKNGFLATVDLAACGGTYRVYYESDRLTSPGYPNSYSSNQNCNTTLITSRDSYFTFNFSSVNLFHHDGKLDFSLIKNSSSCNDDRVDSVVVYDVDLVTYSLVELARACRHYAPPQFESTSNNVLVVFNSRSNTNADSDTLHAGFVLDYSATYSNCKQKLSTPYGNISSPNYPQKPKRYYYCTWQITVPEGRRITVTVVKANFIASDSTKSSSGGFEVLKFYNDHNFNSRLVALTGPQAPGTKIESSSNFMHISYATNKQVGLSRGFVLNYTSTQEALCGGNLDESGIINAPQRNGTPFYCVWVRKNEIKKNQTFVMTVSGTTGLHKRNPCLVYNSVGIYGEDFEKIRLLCSNVSETVTIRSPHSTTSIKAITSERNLWNLATSNPNVTINFTINYRTTNCGGIISDINSVITSPNFPEAYDETSDCAWLLKFQSTVQITVQTVDLESDCKVNFLRIYNGKTAEDPIQKEYCGSAEREIIIAHPLTFIEFHSSANKNGKKGFSLSLSSTSTGVCSGLLVGNFGEITTPNYPNLYPNSIVCAWDIAVPVGFRVGLTFIDRFFIQDSDNCTKDAIMVFDYGPNRDVEKAFESNNIIKKSPLPKFCGRSHPPVFNSTHRWMTVVFESDSSIAGEGFKARWNAICGGVLSEAEGTIISPHYPEPYDAYSNCNYTISAPGKKIFLEFLQFDLETASPAGCVYHNLSIYTYEHLYSLDMSLREVYCGNGLPPKQVYKSVVSLILRSDDFVQTRGFIVKYSTQGCGGNIVTAPTIISTMQSYSNEDYDVSKCQWNITAPEGHIIILWFKKINLSKTPYCFFNALKIYDGLDPSNYSSELATVCDQLNENLRIIKSTTNKMSLVHRGYATIGSESGFEATVLFSPGEQKGCGGRRELNDSSPLPLEYSPEDYSMPMSCEWKIFTKPGHTIQLTFNSINIGTCDNSTGTDYATCDCNRLAMFDGINTLDEHLITYFCNSSNAVPPVITSGNSLLVQFSTGQPSKAKPAFRFTLLSKPSLCGESEVIVGNQTGVLTSPGWPQPYPANLRCIWRLSLKGYQSNHIDVHITDLDIAPSPKCSNDFLQISEERIQALRSQTRTLAQVTHASYKVFAQWQSLCTKEICKVLNINERVAPSTYCESKVNVSSVTDYYSRDRSLKIVFISSSDQAVYGPGVVKKHKGFRLEYRETGCNRNFTRDYGQVQIDHEGSTECIITIRTVKPNATLSLYFTEFLIYNGGEQKSPGCTDHKVTIWDGADDSSKLLRTVCESDTNPKPIFSSKSSVKIHYHSKKGALFTLDMMYTSSTQGQGCGGRFYSNVGAFSSPFYPDMYRNDTLCRWYVTVPEGNVVELIFYDFDLGPASTCATNYLTIYDISQDNEELFGRKYCSRDKIAPYESTSNRVIVESKTNANRAGPGWLVNFKGIKKNWKSDAPQVATYDF